MGCCDIKIEIDDIRQVGFSSLDTIRGKVFINLSSEISLNSIQLKLIGISKTSFEGKLSSQSEKVVTKEEKHLVLYETKTIFPVKESNTKGLTLNLGEHDFQFSIKIPLSNSCFDGQTNMKNFRVFSRSDPNLSGIEFEVPHHKLHTLPPSLSDVSPYASIKYYLKVIIRRPSLLKSTITKEKTIKMSQFNGVDHLHRSRALNFVRKENIFKDKIPEIIAIVETPPRSIISQSPEIPSPPQFLTGSQQNKNTSTVLKRRNSPFKSFLFGSSDPKPVIASRSSSSSTLSILNLQRRTSYEPPTILSHDISFYFEARSYGFLQTIGEPLSLKLYLLSKVHPKKFLGIDGNSSGLGAIYLKFLHIELVIITDIKVQKTLQRLVEHKVISSIETTIRLDFADAQKSKALNEQTGNPMYELKLPEILYDDALVPTKIAPSFKTCNIERRYKFLIVAKFAESNNSDPKSYKEITLDCNITLLSGIAPPFASETAPPTALLPSYDEVGKQT